MTKPFRVLGLQQIANGRPDNDLLGMLWRDIFGPEIKGGQGRAPEDTDGDMRASMLGSQAAAVVLIRPIDRSGELGVHATTLNQVGLWVDDLAKAVEWMAANSVSFAPGGIHKSVAGHDICFIYPKTSAGFPVTCEGALIELVQAPHDVVAASSAV